MIKKTRKKAEALLGRRWHIYYIERTTIIKSQRVRKSSITSNAQKQASSMHAALKTEVSIMN